MKSYGGAVEFEFFDESILYGPDILQLLDHNEAPIFSDGDFGATLDADTFSSLALAGEFSFDDADTADVIDISVASVSATGAIAGIPSNEALLGFIFTQVSRDDTADLDGQARWIFSADPGTFDYLADGELLTLEYTIAIDDGRTGSAERTISIVVNGTNEAPVITGGAAGATLLPSSAAAGASGQIFFADTDVSQSHTVNIASVAVNGSLANIPTLEVLQTWLSTSLVLGNSGERQLNWSFTPQGYDFSALGLTDQLTLTYRIEIVDTSGAVAARDVTIFVRASALAAGTLASVSGAVFEEDSNVDLAVPSSLFVGLLSGDITVSATLADGSPLPSWLSFDGSRLIGSPPANYNGTTELRITANNGVDAVHDFLPLFIEGVNDAPATGEAIFDYRFAAGVAVSILLPDSAFSDADGDDLQLTARLTNGSPLPSWLSFSNGAFAGIAPVDFAGVLELEVRASDGISSASQYLQSCRRLGKCRSFSRQHTLRLAGS